MTTTPTDEARLQRARLMLVVPFLDFGGVESRLVAQARAMRPMVRSLQVVGFTRAGWAADALRADGIEPVVLGSDPSVRNPHATYELWRHIRAARPDVVHGITGAMTIHALLAARAADVPVRVAEEVGIPTRGRAGRRVFPLAYRLATDVVAVSEAVAHHLVTHDGAPATTHVVPNMVADRFFTAAEPRPPGTGLMLAVGRLSAEKGHDVLIRAAAPILRSCPSARLRIVGDGPARPALTALADALGVADRVELLGFRQDIPDLLGAADVFVLPSRTEGSSVALVEAMAMCLPVVASAVGGVPEILGDVAPECLSPPDDPPALAGAIGHILDLDAGTHRRLVARLAERAQDFTAARHADAMASLYTGALAR